jgi:hypothetical protein
VQGLGIDMFHCMRCNQCMALSLSDSHGCRERGLESDCPICHEDLFTSAAPVRQTQCGHFMHSACYKLYTHSKYTCPMCCKSLADMVRAPSLHPIATQEGEAVGWWKVGTTTTQRSSRSSGFAGGGVPPSRPPRAS